jgi:hypothetical protein
MICSNRPPTTSPGSSLRRSDNGFSRVFAAAVAPIRVRGPSRTAGLSSAGHSAFRGCNEPFQSHQGRLRRRLAARGSLRSPCSRANTTGVGVDVDDLVVHRPLTGVPPGSAAASAARLASHGVRATQSVAAPSVLALRGGTRDPRATRSVDLPSTDIVEDQDVEGAHACTARSVVRRRQEDSFGARCARR